VWQIGLFVQVLGKEMIYFCSDIDLATLSPRFTECGDYTKEVILEEFEYHQKLPDFLCLVSKNNGVIDGFLIGYRNRNSLWIAQAWNSTGIKAGRKAMLLAKDWARARGMTSITCETKRSEMRAMQRYGLKEFSVIMRREI